MRRLRRPGSEAKASAGALPVGQIQPHIQTCKPGQVSHRVRNYLRISAVRGTSLLFF